VIENYGFKTPRSSLVTDSADAARSAARIGFPVALKIASPDILHKTDVGGVRLDLWDESQVREAYADILAAVQAEAPRARIDGVAVEEMCRGGVEVIVGLQNDRQFGPTVMFGLGGVLTEVLEDVSFRVLPIGPADARSMLREVRGQALLHGFRGAPAVSEDLLVELLLKAGDMGLDLADRLDSVDLNPVMVWSDDYRVLDAKVLLKDARGSALVPMPNTAHLHRFFNAGSVAVVGASGRPGKIGYASLESMSQFGYQGAVYPVNPGRSEIMGLAAYPSLSAIPEPVELAVATIGLADVPALLRECPQKDTHAMVIISGGGKELGGDAAELEGQIAELASELDVRIVGCNCIGVFDSQSRIDTLFQTHARLDRPGPGPVSILTQSGTVGAGLLEAFGDTGVAKMVSYGNRIDVDEADLVEYLAGDPATQVIVCYVEGLKQGRKFLATASRVAQDKPIVAYKAGRTALASSASVSHTGFFGGTHHVWEGALRQAGVLALDSLEELHAAAKALAWQPRARGKRVALVSNGAGTMIQAMDLFPDLGLELAILEEATLQGMSAAYPPFYGVQNPLDLTGSATTADYALGIGALLQDPGVDLVMPWFVFPNSALTEDMVEELIGLSSRYGKALVCGALGGDYTRRIGQLLGAARIPVYHTVREWVAAAMALTWKPGPVWPTEESP